MKLHFQGTKSGISAILKSDSLIGYYDSNTSFLTPKIVIKSKILPFDKFIKNSFTKDAYFDFELKTKLNYKKLVKIKSLYLRAI